MSTRGGASIDDLLRFEEEPLAPPASRGRGWLRALLRTVLVAGAATAVLVAVLRAVGFTVSQPVLVAGVFALLAVGAVTRRLRPPRPAATVRSGRDDDRQPGRDALRAAVNGWEAPLQWSAGHQDRFAEVLMPRITELADERLRHRHGLTRDSDSARARVLLGERLWTFLTVPGRRPPSPRELAAIVAELERI